ncbi:MAG: DUF1622 domain-containing protein [Leptolyngbya sp. SIO1D8]|nr:DUF1622 domain-containing protein [Leptolyngbya sp. SIO1D8]
MEFFEHLEESLATFVAFAQLALESISVICVIVGLVKTIQLALLLRHRHRHRDMFPFNQIRLRFGSWLALALEFQLGADILATTVTPTLEDLSKLGIVAVIRTFLNYFLGKEIEAEMKLENQHHQQSA